MGAHQNPMSEDEIEAAPAPPGGAECDPRTGRVVHYKGFTLSRFQIEAVEAVRAGRNVLLSAPTGAGKTLVAEYAIEEGIRRGKRCIYTAPIKALSNQKYRDFRDDPQIDVGLMTGDVTIHPRAQVLIVTTEILRNAIFENPEALTDVGYVIFDEVHYMDDLERGSVWEESMIFAPAEMRFLCLSATVANLEQLGSWIGEIRDQEVEVIQSRKRPVPLAHRLFRPGAGIFTLERLEGIAGAHRRKAAEKQARGRGRRGRERNRRSRQPRQELPLHELLDHLQEESLLPALVFSFSRRDCERLAFQNQARELLSPEERRRVEAMQEELVELFQLDSGELQGEAFRLARSGIGYHHAGMLPIHKEVVERMFTSGLLKMLFTTETFALGINMPARSAVFASLRKFDGVSFDYMRTRDYLQMAGRAGRQGIDREGLVIAALDDRALTEAPIQRLHAGKPEPVVSRFRLTYSTILHLLALLGRERLYDAWEKSFNQYQHRAGNRKQRERNQRQQRQHVDAHLDFLEELGYIEDGDQLTARGRMARSLYGWELQITEMLFRGSLENLPAEALGMVFTALVHEERRRWDAPFVSSRLFGGVRRHLSQMLSRLAAREAEARVPCPMKLPDWGLSTAVVGWMRGAPFEDLEEAEGATPGDICRVLRMTLQLMRQLKRVIDPSWDLSDRLEEAIEAINRDEVDARRQLELG